MSLLDRHLEQISLSAESIATLPFLSPDIFVNALLSTPEITCLIRDTKPYENALFSVPPSTTSLKASNSSDSQSSRRQTVFSVSQGEVKTSYSGTRLPRRNTAVAAVLGSELHDRMKKIESNPGADNDLEATLRGIEKLSAVYSLPGVEEKIQSLRAQHERVFQTVIHYEKMVERQTRELEEISQGENILDEEIRGDGYLVGLLPSDTNHQIVVTDEDLRLEQEEILGLEKKKHELEVRIKEMEKDLGGLLR